MDEVFETLELASSLEKKGSSLEAGTKVCE